MKNIQIFPSVQRRALLCLGVLFSIASSVCAELIFPVGTFVYTGCVRDWDGKLLYADNRITIQAVDSKGRILAQTKIDNPTEEGLNYRLEIPLATRDSLFSTTIGTKLNCVVLQGDIPYASGIPLPPVTRANASARCDMVLASDSDKDGVPDEFVEQYAPYLEAYQIEKFDAKADYDQDGASNYAEYVAGTDLFDPSDLLRIREFTQNASNTLASISFEYVGGRIYTVQATTNLMTAAWQNKPFHKTKSADGAKMQMLAPAGDFGRTTLYLLPAAKSEFFRVLVNPGMSSSSMPAESK